MANNGLNERQRLMRVAVGDEPADLVLRGGTVVNVYTGECLRWDVAIAGQRIADAYVRLLTGAS